VPFSIVDSGKEFWGRQESSLLVIGDLAFKAGRTSGIALRCFASVFLIQLL
jgi:hypothetical protein